MIKPASEEVDIDHAERQSLKVFPAKAISKEVQ